MICQGQPRDLIAAHEKEEPRKRPSRRFIGTPQEVRARAERRRMEREIRLWEELSKLRSLG